MQYADQARGIFKSTPAQRQVVLPLSIAARIALQGIRARLGRSVVTLTGIALGIMFLMSVLTGHHLRQVLATNAERMRAVNRRVVAIRGEVGQLRGKLFIQAGQPQAELDVLLLEALRTEHGAQVMPPPQPEGPAPSVVLCFGAYQADLARCPWPEVPRLAFAAAAPSPGPLPAGGEEVGGGVSRVHVLQVEPTADELARAAKAERAERLRMIWIVGISLLITIIGITNAMLMSVTERFREIGTMKCLGALPGFVVKVFLFESSLLGLIGSLAGILAGVLVTVGVYGWTYGLGHVLAAASWTTLGALGGLCLLAGLVLSGVAAVYPARVAAKMIPAMALASNV